MTDENATPDSGPPDDRRSEQERTQKPDAPQEPAAPQERLSADEAAQLVARVAELAKTGLPLPGGLRAAAAELPRGKLARAMAAVAAALERGQSLDQALSAQHGRFPPHLRGLVAAGARSGKLGEVLEQFVQFRQFRADIRRGLWQTLAYPLLLLALMAGFVLFFTHYFIPSFQQIRDEFRTEMPSPGLIRLLFWLSAHEGLMLWVVLAALVAIVAGGWFAGKIGRRSVLNRLPLFGGVLRYSGLAEFSQLLRLLVENGIPLPESLRLTADGIGDAYLAAGCRQLAERVEAGQPLPDAIYGLPQFTPLFRPLFQWGQTHSALPAALGTMARLSTRRVELQTEMLRWIVPPVAVVAVMALISSILTIFLNFMVLAASLSGGRQTSHFGVDELLTRAEALAVGLVATIFFVVALPTAYFIWLRFSNKLPARYELLWAGANILAIFLLGVAILALFGVLVGPLGIELGVYALVIWGIAAFRFRQMQRASLLDLLAAAVERGMPLVPLARAFAAEQPGGIGRRARWLADWLVAGWPLADGVRADGRLLSPQAILALEVGQETGSLPATLPQARESTAASVRNWGGIVIGMLSVLSIATLSAARGHLLPLAIIPAYRAIYRDFHRKLPAVTFDVFAFFGSPVVLILLILAITIVILATLYLSLYAMGLRFFGLPLLDRLLAPLDAAVVLRCLGVAANRGQPLEPTLNLLAIRYPKWLIRRRLRRAATVMGVGGDWVAALRSQRLIRKADAAILRAAAQAGNLGWALSEAAASGERLVVYRLQWLSQIFAPLLVLAAGVAVGLFAIAMLMPLAELIRDMAK